MNNENIQAAMDAIDADERWDTGELGRDEPFVKAVETAPERQSAIDESLGLQMISIRLPKAMIEDFKFLAEVNGLKYQTLMRQVLARFVDAEKKHLQKKAASLSLASRRAG
jgi:predicted DNA binding CopG/RHH family protein